MPGTSLAVARCFLLVVATNEPRSRVSCREEAHHPGNRFFAVESPVRNGNNMKKLWGVLAVLMATVGLIAAGATASQAASKDGVINTGEFVQWYFSGYSGA